MDPNSSSHLVGKILPSCSLILTFLLCCYFINIPLTLLVSRFNRQSLCVSILHYLRKNIVGVNIIHNFVEFYLNYVFNLQKIIVGVCLTTSQILFYRCTWCRNLDKVLDGMICKWVIVLFNQLLQIILARTSLVVVLNIFYCK